MSDLMVDFITSLDSYGTATDWPGYWGMEGPEYLAWLREVGAQEHITLMGATTYRELAGYAAAMPDDPGLAAMTAMPKTVFSSSLQPPLSWANTELVSGDAVEAVRGLKQRESRPVRTVGSIPTLPGPPRGRPRGSPAGRHLPGHHRRHRPAAALRRVSRHHARPRRDQDVRRSAPDARVRPDGPRRPGGGRRTRRITVNLVYLT